MHGADIHRRTCCLLLAATLSACATIGGDKPAAGETADAVIAAADQVAPQPAAISPEAQQQFDTALAALKAGQNDVAKQQLLRLAEAYPDFAGALINLGLMELKADRYDAAAELFKRATQRDAKSAAANNYLGVSYRFLGRFKEAEGAYRAAIAADDSYAAAHLNLGVLYDLYLQQPELALPEYERYQALQAAPDAKIAGWIKELSGRLNANRKAKADSGAQP